MLGMCVFVCMFVWACVTLLIPHAVFKGWKCSKNMTTKFEKKYIQHFIVQNVKGSNTSQNETNTS